MKLLLATVLVLCNYVGPTMGDCGGSLWFNLEDYKCDRAAAVNNNARKVLYDAMESALIEFAGISEGEISATREDSNQQLIFETDSNNRFTGYPDRASLEIATADDLASDTGRADSKGGRQLTVGSGGAIEAIDQDQQHDRNLQMDCEPGLPYPWCAWCGYHCWRRRLIWEKIEEKIQADGRSLRDAQESICSSIQAVVNEGRGIGCLKGAQVKNCALVESSNSLRPIRSDGSVVETTEPLESSGSDGGDGSSGESGANVFNMMVPAILVGAVGFMVA